MARSLEPSLFPPDFRAIAETLVTPADRAHVDRRNIAVLTDAILARALPAECDRARELARRLRTWIALALMPVDGAAPPSEETLVLRRARAKAALRRLGPTVAPRSN
jgi:hypothetical protein